jgi:SOS-response transcriptional repressor LexA
MSEMREKLGELVEKRLLELEMSHQELADLLGVRRQMISQYIAGSWPRPEKLKKLLNILDIPPSSIDPSLGSIKEVDSAVDTESIPSIRLSEYLSKRGGAKNMFRTKEDSFQNRVRVPQSMKHCFAIEMTDNSMAPRYLAGDELIIDPNQEPRNGCRVLAVVRNGSAVVREYIDRGIDRSGFRVYDLSTPNPDYVTETINSSNPATIEGVVVESRRKEFPTKGH